MLLLFDDVAFCEKTTDKTDTDLSPIVVEMARRCDGRVREQASKGLHSAGLIPNKAVSLGSPKKAEDGHDAEYPGSASKSTTSQTTQSSSLRPPSIYPSRGKAVFAAQVPSKGANENNKPEGGEEMNYGSSAVGFDNLGNSCFMNAPLQCIAHLEPYSLDIQTVIHKLGHFLKPVSVTKLLYMLMKDTRKTGAGTVNSRVKRILTRLRQMMDKKFATNTQQDSHELLSEILDRCHEEVQEIVRLCENTEDEDLRARLRSIMGNPRKFLSPPQSNYQFLTRDLRLMLSCKHQQISTEIEENNLMLALTNEPELHLQDCVDNSFKVSEVAMKCDKCGLKDEKATITRKISRRPRILILTLLRYSTMRADAQKKLDKVNIPRFISVEEYVTEDSKPPIPMTPTFITERLKGDSSGEIPEDCSASQLTPPDDTMTINGFVTDKEQQEMDEEMDEETLLQRQKQRIDATLQEVMASPVSNKSSGDEAQVPEIVTVAELEDRRKTKGDRKGETTMDQDDSVFDNGVGESSSSASSTTTHSASLSVTESVSESLSNCMNIEEQSMNRKEEKDVNEKSRNGVTAKGSENGGGNDDDGGIDLDNDDDDDGVVTFRKVRKMPLPRTSNKSSKFHGTRKSSDDKDDDESGSEESPPKSKRSRDAVRRTQEGMMNAAVGDNNKQEVLTIDCGEEDDDVGDDFVPVGHMTTLLTSARKIEIRVNGSTGDVDMIDDSKAEKSSAAAARKVDQSCQVVDAGDVHGDVLGNSRLDDRNSERNYCKTSNGSSSSKNNNESASKKVTFDSSMNSAAEDELLYGAMEDMSEDLLFGRSIEKYTYEELKSIDPQMLNESECMTYVTALSRMEYERENDTMRMVELARHSSLMSMSDDFNYDPSFFDDVPSSAQSSSGGGAAAAAMSSGLPPCSPDKKLKKSQNVWNFGDVVASSSTSHEVDNSVSGSSNKGKCDSREVPDILKGVADPLTGLLCYEDMSAEDDLETMNDLKKQGGDGKKKNNASSSLSQKGKDCDGDDNNCVFCGQDPAVCLCVLGGINDDDDVAMEEEESVGSRSSGRRLPKIAVNSVLIDKNQKNERNSNHSTDKTRSALRSSNNSEQKGKRADSSSSSGCEEGRISTNDHSPLSSDSERLVEKSQLASTTTKNDVASGWEALQTTQTSLSHSFQKPIGSPSHSGISPSSGRNRNLVRTRDFSRLRSPSSSPKKKSSLPTKSPMSSLLESKIGSASKRLQFSEDQIMGVKRTESNNDLNLGGGGDNNVVKEEKKSVSSLSVEDIKPVVVKKEVVKAEKQAVSNSFTNPIWNNTGRISFKPISLEIKTHHGVQLKSKLGHIGAITPAIGRRLLSEDESESFDEPDGGMELDEVESSSKEDHSESISSSSSSGCRNNSIDIKSEEGSSVDPSSYDIPPPSKNRPPSLLFSRGSQHHRGIITTSTPIQSDSNNVTKSIQSLSSSSSKKPKHLVSILSSSTPLLSKTCNDNTPSSPPPKYEDVFSSSPPNSPGEDAVSSSNGSSVSISNRQQREENHQNLDKDGDEGFEEDDDKDIPPPRPARDGSGGGGSKKSPGLDTPGGASGGVSTTPEKDVPVGRCKASRSLASSFCEAEGKENNGKENKVEPGESEEKKARRKRLINIERGLAPMSYRLVGIVNHIGQSMAAGHYTSYCYNLNQQRWFYMDDKNTGETFEALVRRNSSSSGYVFFYMDRDLFDAYADARTTDL